MLEQLRIFQNLAIKQIDAITSVSGAFVQNADKLFAETRDFQKSVLLNNSAWFSKVAFARNVSDAIEAQTEHAKTNYDATLGETRKIGEIITDLTRDTVKSVLSTAPEIVAVMSKTVNAPAPSRFDREAA
jgi:hypothetical protein